MDVFDERALGRAVLESPHVCVITTGLDGVIRTFNKGAENLLGYTAAEMIGKQRGFQLHDPEEAKQRGQELAQTHGVGVAGGREAIISGALLSGQPDENVWTYIAKDGSRHKVLMSLHILRDEAGRMAGYLGVSIPLPENPHSSQKRA